MTAEVTIDNLYAEEVRTRASKVRANWWLARRRWQRVLTSALSEDGFAISVLSYVAQKNSHPRSQEAQDFMVNRWIDTRLDIWRELVWDTGALASHGFKRLASAALTARLDEIDDATELVTPESIMGVFDLDDPLARSVLEDFLRTCPTSLRDQIWNASIGDSLVVLLPVQHPVVEVLLDLEGPSQRSTQNIICDRILSPNPQESYRICSAIERWGLSGGNSDAAKLATFLVTHPRDQWPTAEYGMARVVHELLHASSQVVADCAHEFVVRNGSSELIEGLCDLAMEDPEILLTCKEMRLAPSDLVRRAKFYLITNQPSEYKHVDADGTLLRLIYDAATDEERGQLQQAMLAMRDVSLVRAVVGAERRSRALSLSESELAFLTAQLRNREAWEDLWQLALEMPLVTCVQVVSQIPGDKWSPAGAENRELFFSLRQVTSQRVIAGRTSLLESLPLAVKVARIRFHGRVNDVSFAPDRPSLAVGGSAKVAATVDLGAGKLSEVYGSFDCSVGRVLHLPGGVLIAGERTSVSGRTCRVVECREGRSQTVVSAEGSITGLAQYMDVGYIASARDASLHLVNSLTGHVTRRTLNDMRRESLDWPRSIAPSPDGESIALVGRSVFITDSGFTTVRARKDWGGFADRVLYTNAGFLIMTRLGTQAVWMHKENARILEKHTLALPGVAGLSYAAQSSQVVFVNDQGTLLFAGENDARVLGVVQNDGLDHVTKATSVTVSPSGEFAAVGYAPREYSQSIDAVGFVEIFDLRIGEITSLVERPLASTKPAHLGMLKSADALDLPVDARVVVDLLQRSLEHRFRYDISIADVAALTSGEYDIYLEKH